MEIRGKLVTFWKGPLSLQNGSAKVLPLGSTRRGKVSSGGPGRSEVS